MGSYVYDVVLSRLLWWSVALDTGVFVFVESEACS
jgi:hypothetical protein